MFPFVGRIVLFVNNIGTDRNLVPAIITQVFSATVVNLRVFYDNGTGAGRFAPSAQFDAADTVRPGTWRYLDETAHVAVSADLHANGDPITGKPVEPLPPAVPGFTGPPKL